MSPTDARAVTPRARVYDSRDVLRGGSRLRESLSVCQLQLAMDFFVFFSSFCPRVSVQFFSVLEKNRRPTIGGAFEKSL